MSDKRIIVVLGMHRSGTSAVAKALQVLGASLGGNLLPPVLGDNDKGYWEDADVNALNVELLKSLGHDWHTLVPVRTHELESATVAPFYLRAVQLIRQKISTANLLGVKDPRMSRLLPFWMKVFDHVGVEVNYVVMCRHPMSVARSLHRRDPEFSIIKSYYLWLDYLYECYWSLEQRPRVVVDYDLLMADPELQLSRIAKKLDLPFNPDGKEFVEYKRDFLDSELTHTRFTVEDLRLDSDASPIISQVYEILLGVARDELELDSPAVIERFSSLGMFLANNYPLLQYVNDWETRSRQVQMELADIKVKFAAESSRLAIETENSKRQQNARLALQKESQARQQITQQLLDTERERTVQLTSQVSEVERSNERLADQLHHSRAYNDALLNSSSWRVSAPLRDLKRQLSKTGELINLVRYGINKGGGIEATFQKAIKLYKTEGVAGLKRGYSFVQRSANASPVLLPSTEGHAHPPVAVDRNDYTEWVKRYDILNGAKRRDITQDSNTASNGPLISIVMPTYNANPIWLSEAIDSVRAQLYERWELCIADDASTDARVREVLERYSAEDSRIKVVYRSSNGHISAASNSALELVTGSWVALLDHDDVIPAHALYYVARAVLESPDLGLIYSDEDKIDEVGNRHGPYFKTDWNPDLFYSHNMITHLGIYKKELLDTISGFRLGYEGAQDYDLALRAIEHLKPSQIFHIPRILYHWRVHKESTASSGDAKPYAMLAGERALNDHFKRTGVKAHAELIGHGFRAKYDLPELLPLVSIVIPTRNGYALLKQCIDSIKEKTNYSNYEIIIIDNGSDDPVVLDYLSSESAKGTIKVIRDDGPFNYSALNNRGVKFSSGEIIALLNNDIEVIGEDWLSEMVSHVVRPGVGAVGAKLLYPNDTLQHAGVICGIGGWAGHSHKGQDRGGLGYCARTSLISNFSAVTGACLLIQKSLFVDLGGLNSIDLKVACNDVDLCLKALEAGYKNVWTPYAELYHHESATRGYEDNPEKVARFAAELTYMRHRWGKTLSIDPAYSPNLTLDHEDFSLAWPPRV
jgi:glycosyltransferase involved in cell wall biosynthesis